MSGYTRRVIGVRHGQTEWNALGRIQGHTDTPLNDVGRQQAHALAVRLEAQPLCAIVSSDLARARETASIVAARQCLAVTEDKDLRERCYGVFEGLTWTQAMEEYDRLYPGHPFDRTAPIPNAESVEQLTGRALDALHRAAAHATRSHYVLMVTHGGVLHSLLVAILGPSGQHRVPNAQPFLFELDDHRPMRAIPMEP